MEQEDAEDDDVLNCKPYPMLSQSIQAVRKDGQDEDDDDDDDDDDEEEQEQEENDD